MRRLMGAAAGQKSRRAHRVFQTTPMIIQRSESTTTVVMRDGERCVSPIRHLLLVSFFFFVVGGIAVGSGGATAASGHDEEPIVLRYRIDEELPSGSYIADLIHDSGLRGRYNDSIIQQLEYHVLARPIPFLTVGKTDGVVRTKGRLDRESMTHCRGKPFCEASLDVAVKPVQFFQILRVAVEIGDTNDNVPYFRDPSIYLSVLESAPVGSAYALPAAIDPDSPVFGVQKYSLHPELQRTFRLQVDAKVDGTSEARLTVARSLDREVVSHYRLRLSACDGGSQSQCGQLDVIVVVMDSNDNQPVFEFRNYSAVVPEDIPVGTLILQVKATDADSGLNGEIVYGLSVQSRNLYGRTYDVDNKTGELRNSLTLDREAVSIYHLVVTASDRGPDGVTSEVSVVIHVDDVNDNAPIIAVNTLTYGSEATPERATAELSEDSPVGTFVAHLSASDADVAGNARVTCLVLNDSFRLVWIEGTTEFQLQTNRVFDRETEGHELQVVVRCRDNPSEGAPRTATARVTVRISDVNDNPPRFINPESYLGWRVVENTRIGTQVGRIVAVDDDSTVSTIRFRIQSNGTIPFRISEETGVVVTEGALDREQRDAYEFKVVATDGGPAPLSSNTRVRVIVEDVNDEEPVFQAEDYKFYVDENQPKGVTVGSVFAIDRDLHSIVRYSIQSSSSSSSLPFRVDSYSGEVTTDGDLDREQQSVYRLIVTAADENLLSSTVQLTINIRDINDNAPLFLFPSITNSTVHVSTRVRPGHPITQVMTSDPDAGDNSQVRFSMIESTNDAFRIDPMDGRIFLKRPLPLIDSQSFLFALEATDRGQPELTSRATLTIVTNRSITWPFDDDESPSVGEFLATPGGLATIISGSVLALFVSLFVVVAVVVVKCRQRRRGKNKVQASSTVEWFKTTKTVKTGKTMSQGKTLLNTIQRDEDETLTIFKQTVSGSPKTCLISYQANSWLVSQKETDVDKDLAALSNRECLLGSANNMDDTNEAGDNYSNAVMAAAQRKPSGTTPPQPPTTTTSKRPLSAGADSDSICNMASSGAYQRVASSSSSLHSSVLQQSSSACNGNSTRETAARAPPPPPPPPAATAGIVCHSYSEQSPVHLRSFAPLSTTLPAAAAFRPSIRIIEAEV